MAKYNVSKREAKELGIKRVLIGGGGDDSSSSSSSNDKDISEYREKLLESLKPTKEENELGDQISNVESSRDTGIQAVREKPIEMDPILGQSRNIETRAALELGTLEERLGRLQSNRQASADVISTALGFAVDDRSRQDSLSQYNDSLAFQDKQFNEGVRQYNQGYALDLQQENRLSSTSGSDDYEKTEKALYSDIDSWKAKMRAGTASWSDAWGAIKRDYGLSTNTIDDLLGIDYRDEFDRPL